MNTLERHLNNTGRGGTRYSGLEKGKREKPAGKLEAFLVFSVLNGFLAKHTKYRIFQIQ